jgi:hypothetical protein
VVIPRFFIVAEPDKNEFVKMPVWAGKKSFQVDYGE